MDAVYVSTPHPGHYDAAMLAIQAGKAVLVEKPFTIDAAEAGELIAAARDRGTFLMEAMWTRFLPDMVRVREILRDGVLGDIVSVTAEHGQWFERPGVPPVQAGTRRRRVAGPRYLPGVVRLRGAGHAPAVTAVSDPAFTGVDAQTSMIFQYEGGAHAVLSTTSYARTGNAPPSTATRRGSNWPAPSTGRHRCG